jgi:hypothetical protein
MQRSLCNLPLEIFFVVESAELVPVRTHRAGGEGRLARSPISMHGAIALPVIARYVTEESARPETAYLRDSGLEASNRDRRMPHAFVRG